METTTITGCSSKTILMNALLIRDIGRFRGLPASEHVDRLAMAKILDSVVLM